MPVAIFPYKSQIISRHEWDENDFKKEVDSRDAFCDKMMQDGKSSQSYEKSSAGYHEKQSSNKQQKVKFNVKVKREIFFIHFQFSFYLEHVLVLKKKFFAFFVFVFEQQFFAHVSLNQYTGF